MPDIKLVADGSRITRKAFNGEYANLRDIELYLPRTLTGNINRQALGVGFYSREGGGTGLSLQHSQQHLIPGTVGCQSRLPRRA